MGIGQVTDERGLLMLKKTMIFVIAVLLGIVAYDRITYAYRARRDAGKDILRMLHKRVSQFRSANNNYPTKFDEVDMKNIGEPYYCYYLKSGDYAYSDLMKKSANPAVGPVIDRTLAENKMKEHKCVAVGIGNLDNDTFPDIICLKENGIVLQIQSDFWGK